ncbi:MAG: hypothetical protein HKP48_09130, partial [Winogradskyella sp.]|uniref:hypothetical protein n=1 Tax=Winogradskyella sp. TaxID=1883156 RepID=UPI00180D68DD
MLKNQKFKVLLLLVLTAFLSYQCSNEGDNLVESNINIQTVTDAEALDFLDNLGQNQSQSRSTSVPYVTIYDNYISNFGITNTSELITILPAVLNDQEAYSRVLLLNIAGEIEGIVYSMYSFNDYSTDNFFGEVLITDLEGNFINRFKVDDGLIVSKYVLNQNNSQQSSSSRSISCDCPWECDMCQLEEVVIEAKPRPELGDLFTSVVTEGSEDDYYEITPAPGSGGGGGGSAPNNPECSNGQILNSYGECVTPEEDCGEDYTINEEGFCEIEQEECLEGQIPDGLGSCIAECEEGYMLNIEGDCIAEEGPSCESFNFSNITANWQEAAVIGIRFNIVLLAPYSNTFQ